MFFQYQLPVDHMPMGAAPKPDDKAKPAHRKKDEKKDKKKDDDAPVRTMMIGESPGDDVGYDPKKIPVEDI